MREYSIIMIIIFLLAVFLTFKLRDRREMNLMEGFDRYQKTPYDPADYIKNYYNISDYQRNANPAVHTAQSHTYQDPFEREEGRRKTSATRQAERDLSLKTQSLQGTKNTLEQAFRQLQEEFKNAKK